jgi:predicted transposase YbfD/YdcC
VPASASSPIRTAVDHLADFGVSDLVAVAPQLREVLADVVDPRARRGVRHPLVVVLAAAVCAVAAGAQSYVAIAEWAADLPIEVAAALGLAEKCPCESTIRRVVQRVDGNRFDTVISSWIQRWTQTRSATHPPAGRRAVAVDGKALRGTRTGDEQPRHLLAVIDHQARVVLGQIDVTGIDEQGKAGEIAAFAPLLERLDLTDVVVTADALHTQRDHVDYLHSRSAHWVLTVKGNQPRLRRQLAGLPWRALPVEHRAAQTRHGRREIRSIKVVSIAAGIAFPHAAQAIWLRRRSRPASGRGRWHTETVYAITDLRPHQASPVELAGWIRGHWQIENALHWVRDVTFAEDRSRIRTGHGPQVMASLRNLVISILRLAGVTNIAAALRHHSRNATRPLATFGIT